MSHFIAVVVTKSPSDLDDTLAPFDENREVEPYREVEGKVADKAKRARDFLLDFPQYVPESLAEAMARGALTGLDLDIQTTPGDKTAKPWDDAYRDKHQWVNRDDARKFLADVPDEPLILAYMADDGYTNLRIEGDELVYDSTRNPDSKWDWWTIGGRWRGYFHRKPIVLSPGDRNPGIFCLSEESRTRLADPDYATVGMRVLGEGEAPRPGDAVLGRAGTGEWAEQRDKGRAVEDYAGRADQLQWRDVDLDAMREAARVKAEDEYDKFEAAVGHLQPPTEPFPALCDRIMAERGIPSEWDAYLESTSAQRDQGDDSWRKPWDDAMGEARHQWASHPWTRALREAQLDPFFDDPMEYYCVGTGGREAYVSHWVARAGVPRALVIDGQWITKGEMGWFGMSNDTVSQDEWNAKVQELYDNLDPDLWVTAVDLHI